MASSQDCSAHIVNALREAREQNRPVYINGGGSKRHLAGRDCEALPLDVSAHRGILQYEPGELVITARGGTPISELLAVLAEGNQTLSFEPPEYDGQATLGGTLACNACGPGRPWGGAIRDRVLGVTLINGHGETLRFGGQVMKNVAGYDVSRLQAGALGTLGVLSEISLKVVPREEKNLTLSYAMSAADALVEMNRRAGEPKPLSAAAWFNGQLFLRLSGTASAVEHTARQWGGDILEDSAAPWQGLREMTLPFFQGNQPLWRFSIHPTSPAEHPPESLLIDWCGALRWLRGDYTRAELEPLAMAGGGHVTLYAGGDRQSEVRPTLPKAEMVLQKRLKQSFDPQGLLNPGRLYSWM